MASRSTDAAARRRRGGLLVIGDEVLGRRVDDRNTATVLDAFARHGVVAGEVALLADDVDRIATVLREFSTRFDLVLTTGGVGPTHDDCTWQAVAQATDDPLVLRQDVLAMMERRAKTALSAEQRRMAMLPAGAIVERLGSGWVLRHGDIWVLPGVPSMVASRVDDIVARYGSAPPALCELYFTVDEWDVVAAIDAVVATFPAVQVGSYPLFDPALDHRLRVSLLGEARDDVAAAAAALVAGIGAGAWVRSAWR